MSDNNSNIGIFNVNLLSLVITDVYFGDDRAPGLAITAHYLADDAAISAFDSFDGSLFDFLHSDSGDGIFWKDRMEQFPTTTALINFMVEHGLTIDEECSELAPDGCQVIFPEFHELEENPNKVVFY